MPERRKEKRLAMDPVDLISAEFNVGEGSEKEKTWHLNVFNCSNYGLGLLVPQMDAELLRILNPEDRIENMKLYSEWGLISVNATVRHKTKIAHGRYKDHHILGVESDEIIEICRPMEKD
ncbi:hypothetical protein ACFL03_06730 [Thermodesulfobacteriota bacterium]